MNLNSMTVDELIVLFDGIFLDRFGTRLKSGFEEPLYLPATKHRQAEVRFRADYVSSALHEIAHWCIAGKMRRQLEDYGYWYAPDGRDEEQQKQFENVEVKPQALEWIFSLAAGVKFHLSADNLSLGGSSEQFALAVIRQALEYVENGLPERAEMFYQALVKYDRFGRDVKPEDFKLAYLI